MMETMFLPIDIHEETPLELKKEDYFDKHGSYIMNISLNPCSYEKSPESMDLSNIATHEIFNPLTLLVHKNFERVVVDAYVYHKYCRSRCVNLEIDKKGWCWRGNYFTNLSAIKRFPKNKLVPFLL